MSSRSNSARRSRSSLPTSQDLHRAPPAATIVIIGRPNVGKSTLFNRLIGKRRALVHDEPGVTRDRIEERTQWWQRKEAIDLRLIDTGGLGGERFAVEIKAQVQTALNEADLCLFVFDGRAGILPTDEELILELQREGVFARIPMLAVVNKIDAEVHEQLAAEFYGAGFEDVLTISAEHGRGIDDLQAWVLARLPKTPRAPAPVFVELTPPQRDLPKNSSQESEDDLDAESADESERSAPPAPRIPGIAIVGRPNVGKSTLTNRLLGEQRMVVSPIAGTTVDSIDTPTELDGHPVVLIDTAGIRRKNKTERGIEVLSVVQTRKALERATLAILVLDAETGPTDQDEKIAGLIEEVGCSVILAINKWDLAEKGFERQDAAERIRKQMRFLSYAPLVFMSALKGRGLEGLGDLVQEILHQRSLRIPTHEFTEWVRREIEIHNPANARFYMCHQSGRNPPTFVCHVNDPRKVHFSLTRHLVNALRERWGYMGTPVRMLIMEAQNRKSLPQNRKKTREKAKLIRSGRPTRKTTRSTGNFRSP